MIMSIANLPPEVTKQELIHLFDDTKAITDIKLVSEGNDQKVMALIDMNIEIESAEAMRHRYHHRWWHGRVLNVNVLLH